MISVIIPLYNKEMIIERTLKSVLSQDYNNIEVVVVNDGSTDKGAEVVKSILDPRIILIEQENGGPSKARNAGVKNAKGEWILFLDADDELTEGAIGHLHKLVEDNPDANVIDGSFIVRTQNGERFVRYNDVSIDNNYEAFFYGRTLPSTGHTLFKSELLRKNPYDTQLRRYEDVELIMRILKEARIVTSSYPIFYVNTDYSSASKVRKSISEDFLGYLDFKGKSFWEYMFLYKFYLSEREHYPEEIKKLYPNLHRRYDLLILYKLLLLLHKIHVL